MFSRLDLTGPSEGLGHQAATWKGAAGRLADVRNGGCPAAPGGGGGTALTAISGYPTIGPTRWGSSSRREWTTALAVGRGARGPVLSAVLEDYDIERVYWNGATRGSQTFAHFLIGVNAEGANVIVSLDRDQSERPGRRALGCR